MKARDTLDVTFIAGGRSAPSKNEVAGIAGYISNVSFQIVMPRDESFRKPHTNSS